MVVARSAGARVNAEQETAEGFRRELTEDERRKLFVVEWFFERAMTEAKRFGVAVSIDFGRGSRRVVRDGRLAFQVKTETGEWVDGGRRAGTRKP